MNKSFDLFVRILPEVGVSVSCLSHPHYSAFAPTQREARAQLADVLEHACQEGGILPWTTTAHEDIGLRRLELDIRTLQAGRVLNVPMKFTLVYHRHQGSWLVRVPRLDLLFDLIRLEDALLIGEEHVRHALHLQPLDSLLEVAYLGEERLDRVDVSLKAMRDKPRRRFAAANTAAHDTQLPSAIAEVCRHLNGALELPQLTHASGRQEATARLRARLVNRQSVMLVGDRGVGKSAIVHELILQSQRDDRLAQWDFFATSGARIVSGMRYLGMWQERVRELIEALRSRPCVLFVENLPELLQTGDGSEGLDLASFLLSAISDGDVLMVVEATQDELTRAQRTHASFVAAFEPLLVSALSQVQALTALREASERIAKRAGSSVTSSALEQATSLALRFDAEVAMPGGAIRLLEETASRATEVIDEAEVLSAFCARTGYPRQVLDSYSHFDVHGLRRYFDDQVLGQPEAMSLLTDLVVTLRAGLLDGHRPLGSFLLMGPTGVGKTESAKLLARYFFGGEDRMIRVDMAEYAAPGSAQRMLRDERGGLVTRVRERPFGVVLFDEVEKADSGVHDLLLQVLGEGRLTDATGRTVSFRNTVVFLTSNLGASSEERNLGFRSSGRSDRRAHYLAAARQFFRPELLGRVDHVVPFAPLSAEVVARITDRAIEQAVRREGLARRGIEVQVDAALRRRVASEGHQPRYGARPVTRAVEKWIVIPLANHLAAGGSSARPQRLFLSLSADRTAISQAPADHNDKTSPGGTT